MKNRIWVIDDDQGILDSIQLLFSHYHLNGEFILQPLDVVKKLQQQPHPRVIFMDVFMEGVNGVQLAQQIKANPATSTIPIILMTADPDVAQKVKLAQADGYLQKPFDGTEMLTLISELPSQLS